LGHLVNGKWKLWVRLDGLKSRKVRNGICQFKLENISALIETDRINK